MATNNSALSTFLAARADYLTANGWIPGTDQNSRFISWRNPTVLDGRSHTEPAAVNRQLELDDYLPVQRQPRPA